MAKGTDVEWRGPVLGVALELADAGTERSYLIGRIIGCRV
jgi:hypothetical protein